MNLTANHLQSLYGCAPQKAKRVLPAMLAALHLAQCDEDWNRTACFLAQIGHETGNLVYQREIWGPTKQQLRYEPKTTLSATLGNVFPGDGKRYMGRGWIQVTGRANYAMTTLDLRKLLGPEVPDFEADPAKLELPEWAAMSAGNYWLRKRLNRFSDSGDFAELTRRINGGYNGLPHRQTLYARALMLG